MILIDADALSQNVIALGKTGDSYDPEVLNFRIGYNSALLAVKKLIANAPTIDVQPVKRSEWRYVNYQIDKTTWITGEFICRKCGKSIPRRMGDNPPDYCQHCGADMRGVTE